MTDIYVIAGLGNPGVKYEHTRHNAGFDAVDVLSAKYGIGVTRLKHKALTGDGTIEGRRVLLVKPQTYMNSSGESIREIIDWYKIPLSRLVVIYDDIDLAVGKIRVRPKGSAGTHNGMRSILYHVQSEDFPRVRVGVGKPAAGRELVDFVLGRFDPEDEKMMNGSITRAADAAVEILRSGPESTMNKFNN